MLREGYARIDADAPTGTQLDDNTIARVDSDFYNIIIGVLGGTVLGSNSLDVALIDHDASRRIIGDECKERKLCRLLSRSSLCHKGNKNHRHKLPHPTLLHTDAPAQYLLKALVGSVYDGQRGYFVGSSTFTGSPSSRTNVRTSLPAVKSTASFFR